jgi:uncharacterized membrane protein YkoI
MSRFPALLAALLLTLGLTGQAAAECYDDWSEAAPIVRKQGLLTVDKLTPMAKTKLGGDVVKVTLCEDGGRFVFRVVVREASGSLKTVTVDARNPF